MAVDGPRDRDVSAADDTAATGQQCEGMDYLKRFSRLIEQGKTVLDVGCGEGIPVDAYLVKRGFAVNGIDASARMIERARTNVPEGFYEVKDVIELKEGEYCVDGIVSLHALLHIPHHHYRGLLTTFASFMPNGGALLLTMRTDPWGHAGDDTRGTRASWDHDDAGDNTEWVEEAGFTIIGTSIAGPDDVQHQIILARS
jgi:cyclopropane fatty-acyl-phospholipid synthase-like methyltransferase